MNRFDRILGILLYLRSSQTVSAEDLACRFEVSRRTIYRDIETLSALGVPVYAERGREGGFRLLEGYFLPPLMFTSQEAVSLLLGLTFLHTLPAKPLTAELEAAERKLLAAMPERLRVVLNDAQKIIGFESPIADLLHPEPDQPLSQLSVSTEEQFRESEVLTLFLQGILQGQRVQLEYLSPYRAKMEKVTARPLGIFWDRNRWYLVGCRVDIELFHDNESPNTPTTNEASVARLWRADRVVTIKLEPAADLSRSEFDIRTLLDRAWLQRAMVRWRSETPVRIRVTTTQARQLQQDWYYRYAEFESVAENHMMMTFGEDDCKIVLALLRWLGPGAELIEPEAWRSLAKAQLEQMLSCY